jgi:hypothetical protein
MLTRFFKKSLYSSIIILGIVAILTFLFTIKPNKKLFNVNLVNSVRSLYIEHLKTNYSVKSLKNLNSFDTLINSSYISHEDLVLPFSIEIDQSETQDALPKIDYDETRNLLRINPSKFNDEEFQNLLSILNNFSLLNNNSTLLNDNKVFSPIFFKHINLYFLVHEEDDLLQYNKKVLENLNKFQSDLPLYVKFLFYDKFGGVINRDSFYEDLKTYNSKITFEELQDENYLNLIIYNNTEDKLISYYNKALKKDIWSFNINNLSSPSLDRIISISSLPNSIKNLINSEEVLIALLKIVNSCNFQYSNILSYALNKIEKINKIFSLYETIRTNEKVKEKVKFILLNR